MGTVPKGRLNDRAPFQPSLRDSLISGLINPTLKPWAIVACPSGTRVCRFLKVLRCFRWNTPSLTIDIVPVL